MVTTTWRQQKATGEQGQFGELPRDPNAPDLDAPEPATGPSYEIPTWAVSEAAARVAKANQRLARAGIEQRFEAEWSQPYQVSVRDEEGREKQVELQKLTLSAPQISYEGWTFQAAVDDLGEGKFVVRSAPGVELDGWRPDTQVCEHCGVRRHRSATYLVRHTDGRMMQVGSTCMADFLGVKPAGLWSIGYDPIDPDDVAWDLGGGETGRTAATSDTRMVIATALAVSDMGRAYRPASFDSSTSAAVKDVLWGHGGSSDDRELRAQLYSKALQIRDSSEVDEVLAAVGQMSASSDYADNLKALSTVETTGYKHAGLVASAVAVWNKTREVQVREAAPKAQGWVAPPGTKINTMRSPNGRAGLEVTVERVIEVDGFETYYGSTTDTILLMRTADGHAVKWKAAGRVFDFESGTKLLLTSGSVKANDTYERTGEDQTVLWRVKFDQLDEVESS